MPNAAEQRIGNLHQRVSEIDPWFQFFDLFKQHFNG